jgi:hypothetical protein
VTSINGTHDSEILRMAAGFREGILGGRTSEMMCVAVAWPLQAFLRATMDVESTLMCSDLGYVEHIWLKLQDGRCLDLTADQLNVRRNGQKFPPVYLGPIPYAHRRKNWKWQP